MLDLILGDRTFALICHDAGAANPLIAEVKAKPELLKQVKVFMQGPALTLWKTHFPQERIESSLEQALQGVDLLVSGTGWQSDLEHNARCLAKKQGIPSLALLDHWVNYEMRFERNQEICLPDALLVLDEYAKAIAGKKFEGIAIHLIGNKYLDSQVQTIQELNRKELMTEGNLVLYLLEPFFTDWGYPTLGMGDFQALDYFVTQLEKLNLPENYTIQLRPHPSEGSDKYTQWVFDYQRQGFPVSLSKEPALEKAIAQATWVVGCHSFALIIAYKAGKQVYSSLPPWAPDLVLPYPIKQMRLI